MPALAIVFAVFVVGFEQLVESHFGVLGVLGLAFLTVGWHAKNVTCSCVGAAVLTMLFVQ
ncbi:hypothetical protein [Streptomyces sp. JJ36]|uniref:hypothetical protein n=1 Tax=Streptomyces sp. JJ36 TaxID=2736645 RepID=UPI001F3394C8|nr:hypothetical protein [Streptomyces sp. JJ36]MCF6524174.1 hypothetical protein [Streptomyces sp. JJ36]